MITFISNMRNKWKFGLAALIILVVVCAWLIFEFLPNNPVAICTMEARAGLVINLRDESGNPVEGATIITEQVPFFEEHKGVYGGLYEADGKYKFTVQKYGFFPYAGTIEIKKNNCHVIGQTLNIILKKINELSFETYSSDELFIKYPECYSVYGPTTSSHYLILEKADNKKIKIFQMKDLADEVWGGEECTPQEYIDGRMPKERLNIDSDGKKYEVWLYYGKNDIETQQELRGIFNSIIIK